MGSMNAGSSQWGDLARWLLSPGGKVFDMDFKAFDTSHGPQMFALVAEFFYRLALKLKFKVEDAAMLYILIRMSGIQIVQYMTDVFIKLKGMPSGIIFTLIFNSIVNAILLRMAFIELVPTVPVSEFRRHVREAIVGDDNLVGASDECIGRFNAATIFPLYAKWGYIATPASKEDSDVIKPYGTLGEQTFLKRKFVFDEQDGSWYAPLDEDSIWKAFAFERLESGVTSLQRLYAVAENAQREFFMYGKSVFHEKQLVIVGIFRRHNLADPRLLKWEDLREDFLSGRFTTSDM
jgi:phosphatidylglycerophosphatase A